MQLAPAVQAPQKPLPSQTRLVPQLVPPGLLLEFTQVDAPVAQDVAPFLQGDGLVVQLEPAVHAAQVPVEVQTRLVPQLVPAARGLLSRQASAPVAHEVIPVKQALLELVEQAAPALQTTHWPEELQTWLDPQLVPADRCAPSKHD